MTATQQIEVKDSAARSAQAVDDLRDVQGEKMILNMGPSHPATHGVLRLVLELDGEIITKADPEIGYLHRGDEKIACLLYTSPSPRDATLSRMPSSA